MGRVCDEVYYGTVGLDRVKITFVPEEEREGGKEGKRGKRKITKSSLTKFVQRLRGHQSYLEYP